MRATAQPDTQPAQDHDRGGLAIVDTSSTPSPSSPTGVQLLRTARGLSAIFWGIPIFLLLMSGAVTVSIFSIIQMPAYVLGALAMYGGMMFLYAARYDDRRYRSIIYRGLIGSLLLIYFSPFVYWWTHRPFDSFYFFNILAFTLSAIWTLFHINIIASETGRMLGAELFQKEAHVCGWATATCSLVPLAFYVYLGTRISVEFDCSLYEGFVEVTRDLSPWYLLLVILPFTLTMATTWQAKERCLKALKTRAG